MISALPFCADERPSAAFRPLKAFGHFRKLVANKEDTAQVFYMGECLPSRRFKATAKRFCESELGRSLMDSQGYLPDILDDHDTLSSLPAGSVAHAYVAFMRKEGLSAAGLVEASQLPGVQSYPDKLQWLSDRLRDTHDLAHIMTGYGRDALGDCRRRLTPLGANHRLHRRFADVVNHNPVALLEKQCGYPAAHRPEADDSDFERACHRHSSAAAITRRAIRAALIAAGTPQ